MDHDLTTLDGTFHHVWALLSDGVKTPTSPARTVALATQSTDGGASVRMVVLREANREANTLTIFTHRASGKVRELTRQPRAEILIWDPGLQFQVRLRVMIALSDGSADIWNRFGAATQRNYANTPVPGAEILEPRAVDPVPDPSTFVVLTAKLNEVETLWLAPDVHRRAVFTNERASWIAP